MTWDVYYNQTLLQTSQITPASPATPFSAPLFHVLEWRMDSSTGLVRSTMEALVEPVVNITEQEK